MQSVQVHYTTHNVAWISTLQAMSTIYHIVIFPVSNPNAPIATMQGMQTCSLFRHKSLLSCCQCIQSTGLA